MNLTFRCKHVLLGGGLISKEPIIPITFIGARGAGLNFNAVLDSGSDFVLIPVEVADALELEYDPSNPEKAKVYNGETISTCYSWVTIRVSKGREQTTIKCRCAIQLDKNKQHENIIFGSSFFEHFRIMFDYKNNRFQIKS